MRRRLVIWLVAMLTATALAAVQATPVAAAPTSPAVVAQLPSVVAGTLYLTQHDGAIYEPNGTGGARRIDAARWRDVYAYQSPVAAPTDYVKYPWSSTVYAVTFWSNDSTTWLWQALPLAQWQRAGSPAPRIAGHIAGSTYHRWATSPELFVRGADGVTRKLSFTEWQASGPQPYETRADRGYQKLTWAPSIASMSSISAGQGAAISYAAWAGEDFPSPQQVQRFPGDQFTKDACSDVVVYAGPTMNRAVTFQEYVAAGAPQVRVVNTGPCAPPTVSALAPASGSSAGGTEVVVTGTLLENVTAVTFGSVPARSFTVESPTRLRAVSPTGTAGPVAVRVTTSAGTSAVVSTSTFTYTAPAPSPPAVSSLAPSSGPSVGGTEVVVTGTSFANVTAVSFGSAPARSFTVESGTQLRAVSPTGTAGPVAVRVTTSAGTSAVVSTSTFTYTAVAPAVPSVQDVSGTIAADTTWGPDRAKVYRVTGDVTVAAGATLTLLPGTVVKLGSGRTIVVDGTLAAPGTAASPVAITSDRDDGAAGDTNGDGTATAAGAGDHLGLSVRSTGALALQHTRVAFADTAITATGTTGALPVLDLTTTAISGSTQCIRAVGPVDGSFSGSVRDCQVGISSDFAFDARGVDWGSTSGPAPYGTGIAVEGLSVRVIPWSGYTAPARPALAAPQATPAATTCADVVFLGARGSGELPDSPDPTVPPLFDSDASGFGPYNYVAATKIAEELAVSRPSTTVSYLAVQYLALRAPSYDPRVGYEAYLASVYDGVDKLGQLFATESARCPDSSFVLLGTSQGALVIDLVLDSLTRVEQQDRIAGVVLLANPGRTVGAPGTLWETSDQPAGPGVADVDGIWRDFSPEIDTPLPSWAASRTISLCHQDDVVCAFRPGASVDPHSSYTLAEMHSLALWQASRIAAALPPA